MNFYHYVINSHSGEMLAGSIHAAFDGLRSKITPEMLKNGAILWVEDGAGNRIAMVIDAD